MTGQTTLLAVGDVITDRDNPHESFDLVRGRISAADIAFCQLESNLTTRGTRLPQARHTLRGDPKMADAIRDAGFGVVSFAGNHCMDWGAEAFFDTIDHLRARQLAVVGVGATIAEARQTAVVEHDGLRVAFLAYSSILPMAYWAEHNRPGCAPMRAFTFYEQIEHDQPGTPARIHTFPHREDLKNLIADVKQAKTIADIVIVSLHWGIHFAPVVLADYQQDVAHAAIDAGADAILGHHAHILKGVEVYKNKPIFYSLCNFATDLRMDKAHAESKSFAEIRTLNPNWDVDFDSLYNFPNDSRMSIIAKLTLAPGGMLGASILPLYINKAAQPEIMPPGDPRFGQVRAYLQDISGKAGLATRFEARGDEIAFA
jgi:poly-gamma-glutamate synthesis protein (capsule biosynthesis protein)